MTRAVVRQAAITRAIRAAKRTGLAVTGVETAPDGTVRVLTGAPPARPMSELERWRARKDGLGAAQGSQP